MVALEGLADDGGDVGDLVEADESIDFGKEAGKVFLKTLGEATGHDDFLLLTGGVFLAGVDGIDDGANRFVLGDIDKRAGVNDEHVGQFGIGHEGHPFRLKVSEHDFGIDEVLGTAK